MYALQPYDRSRASSERVCIFYHLTACQIGIEQVKREGGEWKKSHKIRQKNTKAVLPAQPLASNICYVTSPITPTEKHNAPHLFIVASATTTTHHNTSSTAQGHPRLLSANHHCHIHSSITLAVPSTSSWVNTLLFGNVRRHPFHLWA